MDRIEFAKSHGWQLFPYLMPGKPEGEQLWCPPGTQVHIRNARQLPSLPELQSYKSEATMIEISEPAKTLRGIADISPEALANTLRKIADNIENLESLFQEAQAAAIQQCGRVIDLQEKCTKLEAELRIRKERDKNFPDPRDAKWFDAECWAGENPGCQSLKWKGEITKLEAENARLAELLSRQGYAVQKIRTVALPPSDVSGRAMWDEAIAVSNELRTALAEIKQGSNESS